MKLKELVEKVIDRFFGINEYEIYYDESNINLQYKKYVNNLILGLKDTISKNISLKYNPEKISIRHINEESYNRTNIDKLVLEYYNTNNNNSEMILDILRLNDRVIINTYGDISNINELYNTVLRYIRNEKAIKRESLDETLSSLTRTIHGRIILDYIGTYDNRDTDRIGGENRNIEINKGLIKAYNNSIESNENNKNK